MTAPPAAIDSLDSEESSLTIGTARSNSEPCKEKVEPDVEDSSDQDVNSPATSERDHLVRWDGLADPENPQNWRPVYKWWTIMILGFMTFVVSFGSSVWSAAIIATAEELDVSPEVMILGVTLYVIGFAIGPLIFGPLSELYGRRGPLMVGMLGFLVFQIPIGVASNLHTILICRFFGGTFGSATLAIVPGLAVDIFDPVQRAVATMAYAAAVFAGPVMGPIIGEFTVKDLSWHWTGWITFIMGAAFYAIALVTLRETFPPVLLRRKAARLRVQTRNWALHAKEEEDPIHLSFLIRKYGLKPAQMMVKEPILVAITIYISLVYGILYLIFFAYPYSFQEDRNMAYGVSSLPFLAIFVGVLCACGILSWETKVIFTTKLNRAKKVIPEERLPPMIAGGVILTAGLFWFAWSSLPSVNIWAQIISGVFIGCGIVMVFMPAVIYLIDVYLFEANSALAANAFIRSIIAAVFPLFSPIMYRNLGTQWATSLLAFLCMMLVPVTILLYKYGARIRSWSKFAYNLG